jgi:hypothetical protein
MQNSGDAKISLISLLSDASKRLEQALKHVDISEDAIARLQHPKASLSVSIPVRMDDGSLKVFSGYQVRYDLDLKQRLDEELAQEARYRSEAFAELYQRNLKAVDRYHLSRVGNVHDAQELTAKTFLAAQEAIAMNFFNPFF